MERLIRDGVVDEILFAQAEMTSRGSRGPKAAAAVLRPAAHVIAFGAPQLTGPSN